MLNPKGWDKVFEVAKTLGADSCELYGDLRSQNHIYFELKHSRARHFETGGVQLVLQTASGPKTFLSSIPEPEHFISMLLGKEPSLPQYLSQSAESKSSQGFEKHRFLDGSCRRTLLEHPELKSFFANYTEETKHFLFANDQGILEFGSETFASLNSSFHFAQGNNLKTITVQKGRTDIPSFLSELEDLWLSKHRVTKALQKPWPAPQGPLPVLWSSSVVAKLMLCFIRQLEFHSSNSEKHSLFVESLPHFSFQIIDNWKQEKTVDVEGRSREPQVLVAGGKSCLSFGPHLLGHARRQTHRHFPVTAPWEPAVLGIERIENPVSQLDKGLAIYEAEILDFNPASSQIVFRIQEAALVHQGQEGDWIEPVLFSISLPQLLGSFRLFSEASQPHPLILQKGNQKLFVEVTAPSALSSEMEFPGTVPFSHYW
jgi:predicted Zn-dependent protease